MPPSLCFAWARTPERSQVFESRPARSLSESPVVAVVPKDIVHTARQRRHDQAQNGRFQSWARSAGLIHTCICSYIHTRVGWFRFPAIPYQPVISTQTRRLFRAKPRCDIKVGSESHPCRRFSDRDKGRQLNPGHLNALFFCIRNVAL